ncbi:hypothetical protein B0H14DRAFT_2598475 [Mycena olivaceomarginata]|nr:hypothetical protein B0H14DRAFT_2598475 [Mycena olivaceomarginata]
MCHRASYENPKRAYELNEYYNSRRRGSLNEQRTTQQATLMSTIYPKYPPARLLLLNRDFTTHLAQQDSFQRLKCSALSSGCRSSAQKPRWRHILQRPRYWCLRLHRWYPSRAPRDREGKVSGLQELVRFVPTEPQAESVKQYGAKPLTFDTHNDAEVRDNVVNLEIAVVYFLIDASNSVAQVNFIKALGGAGRSVRAVHLLHVRNIPLRFNTFLINDRQLEPGSSALIPAVNAMIRKLSQCSRTVKDTFIRKPVEKTFSGFQRLNWGRDLATLDSTGAAFEAVRSWTKTRHCTPEALSRAVNLKAIVRKGYIHDNRKAPYPNTLATQTVWSVAIRHYAAPVVDPPGQNPITGSAKPNEEESKGMDSGGLQRIESNWV